MIQRDTTTPPITFPQHCTASKRVQIQANKTRQQILMYVKSKCNEALVETNRIETTDPDAMKTERRTWGQACCQERRCHSCKTLLTIILGRHICGILLRQILAERSFGARAHTHTHTVVGHSGRTVLWAEQSCDVLVDCSATSLPILGLRHPTPGCQEFLNHAHRNDETNVFSGPVFQGFIHNSRINYSNSHELTNRFSETLWHNCGTLVAQFARHFCGTLLRQPGETFFWQSLRFYETLWWDIPCGTHSCKTAHDLQTDTSRLLERQRFCRTPCMLFMPHTHTHTAHKKNYV